MERADVALLQRLFDLLGGRAERRARFRANLRHSDHHHALGRVAVCLHDRVLPALRIVAVERGTHLLDRDRLVELLDHHGAARELHAAWDPLRRERDTARDDDDPRERNGVPAPAKEVVVRMIENMHG